MVIRLEKTRAEREKRLSKSWIFLQPQIYCGWFKIVTPKSNVLNQNDIFQIMPEM